MNKKELVEYMAKQTKLSQANCELALKAFQDAVHDTLQKGDNLTLVGFGTFKVAERAARSGRNPSTGAEIKIPARKVPKFVVGKKLKDSIK